MSPRRQALALTPSELVSNTVKEYVIKPHCIEFEDLYGLEIIEEGTFGQVYKGFWEGLPVAVKLLRKQLPTVKAEERFWREILIMTTIHHPNVVSLFAVCTNPPNRCLVMELMECSLTDAIVKKPHRVDIYRKKIAEDIARGLWRLHTNNPIIIHRDLKPDNILLTQDFNAKIADLGLSRWISANDTDLTVCGTLRYKAPELWNNKTEKTKARYTHKLDVYSYGLILWELITKEKPYIDLLDANTQIVNKKKKGFHPHIGHKFPADWANLIAKCWDMDSDKRPDFDEILEMLQHIES